MDQPKHEEKLPGAARGRAILPPERIIRKFWAPLLWHAKGFDSARAFLEPGACFACTLPGGEERAHIEPRHAGGSDGAHNLHMLCHPCHEESENLHGQRYWIWFLLRTKLDGQFSRVIRCGVNPTAVLREATGEGTRADRLAKLVASGQDFRPRRGRR